MLRSPFAIKCLAQAANLLLKFIYKTCRVEIHGFEKIRSDRKQILMFWHERIAMAPEILHRAFPDQMFNAFVSNSRDGSYLAAIVESYPNGKTIRVPHDLRHEALRQVIRSLNESDSIVVMTPDGPRGPRHEIKGGIVLAAKKAQALIIPMSWSASRYWEFNTWDRLKLPKPFSSIKVTVGDPIDLQEETLETQIATLEKRLTALEAPEG